MDNLTKYGKAYYSHLDKVYAIEHAFGELYSKEMREKIKYYGTFSIAEIHIRCAGLLAQMNAEMSALYSAFTIGYDGRMPAQIVEQLKARLMDSRFCFQGGLGHKVYSSTLKFPYNWCIKPEFYQQMKPTDFENVVLTIEGHRIEVSEKAYQQHWNGC
jgi:hypothetical protein